MAAQYSKAFIEQALVKAFSRGNRTITSLAEDLNVNHHTLRYWMKNKPVIERSVSATREKRPRTGLLKSSWWHCMKHMAWPEKPCKPGAASEAYSPIIWQAGRPLFARAEKWPRQVRAKCGH